MGTIIPKRDLQVGQWVQFSAMGNFEALMEDLSKEETEIYANNQIFLVISREDNLVDKCSCYFIDLNGKPYFYCPRLKELDTISMLWTNTIITSLSEAEVEAKYGIEKMLDILHRAAKYVEGNAYFQKDALTTLSSAVIAQKILALQLKTPYAFRVGDALDSTLDQAAQKRGFSTFPTDLGWCLSLFLIKKDGVPLFRLNKTTQEAAENNTDILSLKPT